MYYTWICDTHGVIQPWRYTRTLAVFNIAHCPICGEVCHLEANRDWCPEGPGYPDEPPGVNVAIGKIGYERLRFWDCAMTLCGIERLEREAEPILYKLASYPRRLWRATFHAQDTTLSAHVYRHMCYLAVYVSSHDLEFLAGITPDTWEEDKPPYTE